MELIQILSNALLDIVRVDAAAADDDAACRKQIHIILKDFVSRVRLVLIVKNRAQLARIFNLCYNTNC